MTKLENYPTLLMVVAAAFARQDGCWLMQRRPENKHHGGLWEFPGGKVDPGETPVVALIREIEEELGVQIKASDVEPAGFAESAQSDGQPAIVILLYKADFWSGEPEALEGGKVGWFTPAQIRKLSKPPLDDLLVERLFGETFA